MMLYYCQLSLHDNLNIMEVHMREEWHIIFFRVFVTGHESSSFASESY